MWSSSKLSDGRILLILHRLVVSSEGASTVPFSFNWLTRPMTFRRTQQRSIFIITATADTRLTGLAHADVNDDLTLSKSVKEKRSRRHNYVPIKLKLQVNPSLEPDSLQPSSIIKPKIKEPQSERA